MKQAFDIGLVGCGEWGRHILRDLSSLGCRVFVAAPSESSRERARRGGAVAIVDRAEALPAVDAIVVAVPIVHHVEVLDSVLGRGVPVFAEKPLTADAPSAARLAAAAPDRLFVMEKWRYHAGVRELAAIAAAGSLGVVRGLRTRRVQPGNRHAGIDPTWVLLPHDLSIAREILGRLPAPRAAVGLRGEAGGPAGLLGLCSDRQWFAFEASVRSPLHRREIEIHADGGTARWSDEFPGRIEVVAAPDPTSTAAPVVEHRIFVENLPLLEELATFVGFLRGGAPPKSSAAEGAEVVAVVARLLELAADGERA